MPLKMMCVVAHPDDECFAFGGALALAAREGVETYVLCLTDGQAATNRGAAATGADLGQIRRKEFAESCDVLEVAKHELLGYQDGQLEFASVHEVAGVIVERIRQWKPDVVLTFGTDGALNIHADHTMVSCFTSSAFHWAARTKRYPEQKLQPHIAKRLYHLSTSFVLPDREPLLPAPWNVTLDIAAVLQQKMDAFRKHTSQLPVFDKVKPFWDTYGSTEHYVLAAASAPQPAQHAISFFSDIEE